MAASIESSKEHQLVIDESKHFMEISRKFNRLRTDGKKCDVIIKVEGKEIHVHSNVMMAGSDYFDAMFSHDTKENRSGVVEMREVTFTIMEKCVIFIYTGKISVTHEECEPLLYIAGMLQLETVREEICLFLESRLNPASFFITKKIAVKFSLESLITICDQFAVSNLAAIVQEDAFGYLDRKYISFLVASIDVSDPRGEDSKLAIILQWIKSDLDNRRQNLFDLLSSLDVGKLSPGYNMYLVENEPLCSESLEFMKLLHSALFKRFNMKSGPCELSQYSSDKEPNSLLIFDKSEKSLQAYRPVSKTWTQMHQLKENMLGVSNYTAGVMENFVYVLVSDGSVFRILYNDSSSTWEQKNSMLVRHGKYLGVAVHGDYIYVSGNGGMERYSHSKDEWDKIDCDGILANYCSLVRLENWIYTIGGYRGEKIYLNCVNKIATETLEWSNVTPMHVARCGSGVTSLGKKIYVVGGTGPGFRSEFECYDPNDDSWTKLCSMHVLRTAFSLCAVQGKLYAVGHLKKPFSIEQYDQNADKWEITETASGKDIEAQASVAVCLST